MLSRCIIAGKVLQVIASIQSDKQSSLKKPEKFKYGENWPFEKYDSGICLGLYESDSGPIAAKKSWE
jgi:hypothetical protein